MRSPGVVRSHNTPPRIIPHFGKVTEDQFWHVDHDETWGDAYVASSLKHVMGPEAQQYYDSTG